jgi:hypothetical protein
MKNTIPHSRIVRCTGQANSNNSWVAASLLSPCTEMGLPHFVGSVQDQVLVVQQFTCNSDGPVVYGLALACNSLRLIALGAAGGSGCPQSEEDPFKCYATASATRDLRGSAPARSRAAPSGFWLLPQAGPLQKTLRVLNPCSLPRRTSPAGQVCIFRCKPPPIAVKGPASPEEFAAGRGYPPDGRSGETARSPPMTPVRKSAAQAAHPKAGRYSCHCSLTSRKRRVAKPHEICNLARGWNSPLIRNL